LNQQRKPLSKLDLFKAALAAGDDSAHEIGVVLEKCGLRVAAHTNHTAWKPGDVSNIGGIQAVWKHHGRRVVEPALHALAQAFEGQVLRYAGTIFPGLAAFLVDRPTAREGVGFVRLIALMKAKSQVGWRKAIQNRSAETGSRRDRAGREVIAAAYDGKPLLAAPAQPLVPSSRAPTKPAKPPMTFDEQLEAVANGAKLVEVQPIRRPNPDITLGGVTGEINL
jgi:hypothetical protein